uniref:Treslin STD domain-containing protein n=2 Tax=Vombatus ursinus TaxID=29139 RepID=A0A4X2KBJ6_VOMUR
MKSMSRSLKMLNVARLNVKAQKLQPDCSPSSSAGEKIVQKATSRRPEEKLEERGKTLRSSKPKDFKTEEELLSHLNETYQRTVAIGEVLTHTSAQNMILAIKMFLKSRGTKDLEMTCLDRVKNYLLKTSKGLRQQLRKNLDKEAKVREYQLQVFLRLEMCLQCPSVQNSLDDMEHLVEEVTDLLRAVCLTEDPAYLSGFLEEILGLYIDSIPKTLGNLYYSLGFVIPQKLAVTLPADFFSDDSMTQEGGSPTLSVPHSHSTVSVSTESDQLEELRSRSAKKRKHALTRHRSVTEAAQNLRQIEIPKVPKRATKKENFHPGHQQPPLPVKDLVQEVTKVRRNLFNQEILSPSKRSVKRLPRSHSVSAVEGLKYKADNFKEIQDYHKLLTKRVSETPLHKQVSRRLLQRQIKGRSSDPGPDIDVVEESPEKEECEMSLRRSPRIKHLSFVRTNSASFYPISQPKPRNIQRACLRQKNESGTKECPVIQGIRSPKRLLFGAVSEMTTPTKEKHQTKRSPKNSLDSEKPIVYQTPRKSDQEPQTPTNKILRRSPRTPQIACHTPRKQRKTTSKTTSADQMTFKNSTEDFPSDLKVGSLSEAKVIPQKGSSLLKENPFPLEKVELRTPKRQRSQTPELLEIPPWSLQRNSSLASVPFTIQTITNCLTPIKHSQKAPQKSAASASPRKPGQVVAVTPLSQRNQDPNVLIHTVSQPMEYIKELKDKTTQNIKASGHMVAAFTPPISSQKKKLFNSPPHDASMKTPTRKFSVDSLSPRELGEFGWGILQKSPNMTVRPLACNLISTPRKSSRVTKPSNSLPPPPSKTRKQHVNRNNSILERSLPLHQFNTSDDPTVEQRDMATMDSPLKKEQKKLNLSSPFSPKEHFHPLAGVGYEWLNSSPILTTQNTIEQQSSDYSETCIRPAEELKTALTYEQPSISNEVASPPAKPKSPLVPSYALRCTADRRQRQAAARLADPKASPQLSEDHLEVISASPPTYEVELEMQASGLPKLRIKRVDSTSVNTENQKKVDTPLGGENFPDLGCLLHQSKPSQLEAAYVSPPCVRSSHTTPGKSGGQMYICQSYTPTHFPSSTTSPSPTDVWVPWTPSPRHKGKTTPDTIRDWPRKKKAVDSNINSCGGRNERGSDLLGNVSGIEEEGKEGIFEQCISKTTILGDFELEGVYRLPDQSPSSDCEPRAEDGFSKGQFGLFCRKRPLSSKEENEHQTRRSCGNQKGNQVISADNETKEERKSPSRSTRQPSSMGDDEVFVSGCTPPNGTVRSCLSASGLRALTQSPLLYQGKAPSFQRKDIRDEEMDVLPSTSDQESPFNITISQRHPLNRTYTRKRLLS